MAASPVIFLYRVGFDVRSAWVPSQAFKNVAGLCASAPHIVEHLTKQAGNAAYYTGPYQAFWYDENKLAHNTEPPRADVLMVIETDIAQRGISFIKSYVSSRDHLRDRVNTWQTELRSHVGESNTMGNRIFIVHGHDKRTLNKLDHTLRKSGLEPITFNSLPKKGSVTNIEHLEKHVPEVDGFVCLLTPDDEGRKRVTGRKKELPWEPRARENVLIKAGYAIIDNRDRSLLIAIGGVSIPSDFDGIQRVEDVKWTNDTALEVAKRLDEMEFSVDIKKLL